jgi:glycosyltransferase involved in cell wall biosynthesis
VKRSLWVTQVYPRFADDMLGGFLHRLAREMPGRGWEIHVLAPGCDEAPGREEMDGVRVRRFSYDRPGRQRLAYTGEMHRRALRDPIGAARFLNAFARAVGRSVDEVRPDLIHAHWWIPPGLLAVRRRAATPVAISLHGTDVRLAREIPPLRPLAAWTLRRAARVLPVSASLSAETRRLVGGGNEPTVLPMPADARVFDAEPGESSEPAVFTVAARLTRQKRVDRVLGAIASPEVSAVGARLHVAGDGPERARLENLARALGIGDRVEFHGTVSPVELARLYRASRAVVLASVAEGYGLTVVEAALGGIPAVGVRSGGLGELIVDGETGWLAEPDDPTSLAAALARAGRDGEEARRLGRCARERARERTGGPLADRLATVYGEILARS